VRWKLAGRPWRILAYGDLRIPVWRRRPSKNPVSNRLYPQHYVRMAAYCHLLEQAEPGAISPYGIVLEKQSYIGMTVPNLIPAKRSFHDALVSTRTLLERLPIEPPAPNNPSSLCTHCPHNRPDDLTGISICGARFHWTPPDYIRYYPDAGDGY